MKKKMDFWELFHMFEEDFSPIDSVVNENEALWEFKEIIEVIHSLPSLNVLEFSS